MLTNLCSLTIQPGTGECDVYQSLNPNIFTQGLENVVLTNLCTLTIQPGTGDRGVNFLPIHMAARAENGL